MTAASSAVFAMLLGATRSPLRRRNHHPQESSAQTVQAPEPAARPVKRDATRGMLGFPEEAPSLLAYPAIVKAARCFNGREVERARRRRPLPRPQPGRA